MKTTTRFCPERLPVPRIFYEDALGKLSKPSRGWCRGRCPFHESKSGLSFAVNLDNGGFYCFGCDAKGGDIIDFVALRDHVTKKAAAQSLGAWDGAPLQIDEITIRNKAAQKATQERERARQAEEELKRRYFEAEAWLYAIEAIYRDFNSRLSDIRSGRAQSADEQVCWHVLALALDECREAEQEFIRVRCSWPGAPRRART